ncbi:MAG: 30S ribosomal protein S19 [Nanoarchaeota archaeon]
MVKQFNYHGYTAEQLKKIELKEFMQLLPSRQRRSIKHGFTEQQKKLLTKIEAFLAGKYKKPIKTHCRNMIILPKMIDLIIHVYKGNKFVPINIPPEAVGMFLGELLMTRQKVEHSAPGIGATKSSSAISVK